jgi:hypothetical protein
MGVAHGAVAVPGDSMSPRSFWSTRAARFGLPLVLAASLATLPGAFDLTRADQHVPTGRLPPRLDDADFWALAADLSEPGGYFRITDNFTSNELEVGRLVTMLREEGVSGGVYLGVGPEQNFSYIAAVRPAMAFIVDIRRQAAMQHLMFKAIFELTDDRAGFLSLLFSKPRPSGIDRDSSIQEIWQAYWLVATDSDAWPRNRARILRHITRVRGFSLSEQEAAQLGAVYDAFYWYGPSISTRGSRSGGRGSRATFADLTGYSYDVAGRPQSFLSSAENFEFVKMLHERNLIVPVSGDFGGPKALRAIGEYLRERGAVVSAFYVSNVEQYLFQDGKSAAFYDNVATLPLDDRSVFIRPYSLRRGSRAQPLCPIGAFLDAVGAGRVYSNNDALVCRL